MVKLVANYRSSSEIVGVANRVIADAPGRYRKRLTSKRGKVAPVHWKFAYSEDAEADFVATRMHRLHSAGQSYGNMAVLVRVTAAAEQLRDDLAQRQIPCRASSGAGEGVSVMTLHQSKGLEFPYVFLAGADDGMMPHYFAVKQGEDAIEEERDCSMSA